MTEQFIPLEELQSLINAVDSGISILDLNGGTLLFNSRMEKMIGDTLAEAQQAKGLLDLLSPMISKPHTEGLNSSNQINTFFMESEFPPKTHRIALGRKHDGIGQPLWGYTRGQAFWNEQGEPFRMIGLNAKITMRKQTETALIQSERYFRQIFTEVPIGIIRATFNGELLQINSSFCQMLGYLETQLLSLTLQDITHPEDLKTEASDLEQMINEKISIYQRVKRYIKQNKDILWSQMIRGSMQKPGEEQTVLIDMVQDISKRHQIEQMKDDFLSIITHELRTPLTSLRGALNLLSTGKLGELSEPGQKMLGFAITDAELLARLITDRLDLERLKSGTITVTPQRCRTQDLIDQVMQIVQPLTTFNFTLPLPNDLLIP